MIRINLLPHREQARKERRQQFIYLSVLVVLAGGLIWFFGSVLIGQRIETQVSSNGYLKTTIAALEEEISEISRLKEQTQSLLARKQVIESLQGNRTQTVMVFNELVRQMPEGVFLKTVKQTGNAINLTGYAQSNARVSQLMRNLDASPIFEKPLLQEIKAVPYNRRQVGEFSLNVSIEQPPVNEPALKAGVAASAPAGGKQ
jgi:type IV pilus assembly protein PilN